MSDAIERQAFKNSIVSIDESTRRNSTRVLSRVPVPIEALEGEPEAPIRFRVDESQPIDTENPVLIFRSNVTDPTLVRTAALILIKSTNISNLSLELEVRENLVDPENPISELVWQVDWNT